MPVTSPSAERLLTDPLLSKQHGTQTLLSLVQSLHGLSEGESTARRIQPDVLCELSKAAPRTDLNTLEGVRTAVRALGVADAKSLALLNVRSDAMEARARRLFEHEFFASRRSIPGAIAAPLAPGEDPIEADLLAEHRGALLRTWAEGSLILMDGEEGPIGRHKEEFRRALTQYSYLKDTAIATPIGEVVGPMLIASARFEAAPLLPSKAFDPNGSSEAIGDTLLSLACLHTAEEALNHRLQYDNALALEMATNEIIALTSEIAPYHLLARAEELIEQNAATQAARSREVLREIDATDFSPTLEDVAAYSELRQRHYRAEKHGYLRAHAPFANLRLDLDRQADPVYAPAAVPQPLPSAPPRKRKSKARSR